MKESVEHILGNNEARNLYIGTFHSVYLREYYAAKQTSLVTRETLLFMIPMMPKV